MKDLVDTKYPKTQGRVFRHYTSLVGKAGILDTRRIVDSSHPIFTGRVSPHDFGAGVYFEEQPAPYSVFCTQSGSISRDNGLMLNRAFNLRDTIPTNYVEIELVRFGYWDAFITTHFNPRRVYPNGKPIIETRISLPAVYFGAFSLAWNLYSEC